MSFLSDLANIATGGLGAQIADLAKAYFPPDMPAEKKMEFQMQAQQIELDRYKVAEEATDKAEQALNERIALYEGTAADLKAIPILGSIMLFLRGSFRPLMAYAVMVMDWQVYSGAWKLAVGTQENSFYVVNFLVLGFFFGERAIQNVMPLVTNFISAKKGV